MNSWGFIGTAAMQSYASSDIASWSYWELCCHEMWFTIVKRLCECLWYTLLLDLLLLKEFLFKNAFINCSSLRNGAWIPASYGNLNKSCTCYLLSEQ